MSTVIQVDRVSKEYRLGQIGRKRLADDINRWWARFRGKEDPLSKIDAPGVESRNGNGNGKKHSAKPPSGFNSQNGLSLDHIWALKDISLEVKQGEVLGIIGRNGAGKSTLLKILSRVTAPTSGEVRVKGRIASLLEVGTGFHPELTGRENIFLNGAIMGMTRAEIRSKFDEIVAFSEVEKFIDTPVKRYSSGMYVRLAFAVAAHLDPEILVVDEVLAVGDVAFQRKCLGKMGDVAKKGRTILFVSHNMIAIQSLCRRALLIGDGSLIDEGPAANIVGNYLRLSHGPDESREWTHPNEAPGNDVLRVKSVRVLPEYENGDAMLTMQSALRVVTEFWIIKPNIQTHLTYHLTNDQGVVVLTTGSPSVEPLVGFYRASFSLPGNLLNSGGYQLTLLIVRNENQVVYRHENLTSFTIHDVAERTYACMGREPGVVQPVLCWDIEESEETRLRAPAVRSSPGRI